MENTIKTRKTTNRKLESYLYAMGIMPLEYKVLWDGMVQWTYKDTELFRMHCDAFRDLKVKAFKESQALNH